MHNAKELEDLEQIKTAISQLDLKGTNETVTKAMTIVSVAADRVNKGQLINAFALLNEMKSVIEREP
jgi:hypothetical protein